MLIIKRKLKNNFLSFSYISGVTILGTPAEIYNYGSQYWLIIVPILLMGLVVSTVYLPVFSSLKVGSSYEVCSSTKQEIRKLFLNQISF